MTQDMCVADESVDSGIRCVLYDRVEDLLRRAKGKDFLLLWAADQIQTISEMKCDGVTRDIERQIMEKIRAGFHRYLNMDAVDYRKSVLKFIEFKEIMDGPVPRPLLIDPRISRDLKCTLINVPIGTFVPDSWIKQKQVDKKEKPYLIWFNILSKTDIPQGEREKMMRLLLIDEIPELILHYRSDVNIGNDKFLFYFPPGRGTWLFYFNPTPIGYSHLEFSLKTFSENFSPRILVAGAERK